MIGNFIAPSVEDEMPLGIDLVFFFREGCFGWGGAVECWIALNGVEGGALLLLVEG
jgi:hypothetical protein